MCFLLFIRATFWFVSLRLNVLCLLVVLVMLPYLPAGWYLQVNSVRGARSSDRSTSAQNRQFSAIPGNSVSTTCPPAPHLANTTLAMTSKLKALNGCSSQHLQGAGAYCGGTTEGLLLQEMYLLKDFGHNFGYVKKFNCLHRQC